VHEQVLTGLLLPWPAGRQPHRWAGVGTPCRSVARPT